MASAYNAFFNVIQRLRLKSAFLYAKNNITKLDHDATYKLGYGPRTNTNHMKTIFGPCENHLQSLKKTKKAVGRVAHTGHAVRCTTIAVSSTMSSSKRDIALCLCIGLFQKRFTQVSTRVLT